ncbi:MAG: PQQ-binding-like beta-propeller repeat protein [Pontiellaceae bacterium]|nr:PQQ-binding-like beta-propeller repeat protein [Pontiellaceae bacterium]
MKIWIVCFLLMGVLFAQAEDWPAWRGPSANGTSAETGWNTEKASVKWTKEVGVGYSSVTVKDEKLFTAGFADGNDTVFCLDASSGDEVWKYSYHTSSGSYKGPRATPVIDGENLCMVSRDGVVYCLTVSDGKLIWKTDVLKVTGAKNSTWGIATSAVIHGDLVLLNIGNTGTALDKTTGKVVWSSKGEQGYASPVVFEFKGKTCLFLFAEKSLEMVEAKTGKSISSYKWKTKYGVNGGDPLLVPGNKVFISTGYKKGCALLDYSSGKLEKVWENNLIQSHFGSCVLFGRDIYGIDGQTKSKGFLRCISVEDGSEKWSTQIGFGSLMAADGKLIVLGEKGILHFAKAVPDKYEEIARFNTGLKKLCWTQPVLANGTVYCRNDKGKLVAVDVSK